MTGVIIQARMSSARLPGKVLASLAGTPVLLRVVDAARAAVGDDVVVATSTDPSDDPVVAACSDHGVRVRRGQLGDVATRLAVVAADVGFDAFARVSGDSPLLRTTVLRTVLHAHGGGGADVTTNVRPRTFPPGQSVEVVGTALLNEVAAGAMTPEEREHVLPWFYARPERYVVQNVTREPDLSMVPMTVDVPGDLEVLGRAIRAAGSRFDALDLDELAALVVDARRKR